MAIEEVDSISLGLKGDASSLLTALTKGANAVVKFTNTVTGETERATFKLDAMFAGSARAVSMLQTPLGELSPELSTLTNLVSRLAETFRKADNEIGKTGNTTKGATESTERAASAVAKLNQQYKAGVISLAEYTAKLREQAETAEAGSATQLAAMARLKAFRDNASEAARRESERDTAQRLKDLANAERDEKKATADRIKGIREIEAAQAKADRERAQAERKQNKGEGAIAHGLGTAANTMLAGVTAPAMFAGFDAVKAASALNEQESKTRVVFKESADDILKWSKTSSDAFAMSQRAALDEASSVGNFLQELGTGPQKTAEMSRTLVELSGNFASLYDKSPEEIMTKFRAGLSGVSKPLKQFGIDVSIAALKQEAYADGIAKPTVNLDKLKSAQFRVGEAQMKLSVATDKYGKDSYEAMRAQDALSRAQENLKKVQAGSMAPLTTLQKAQAAYAIILKHSANAQADYKNTFDQEANTRRRLAAEVEDCAAAYGKALLPALIKAEHQLEGVVKWFKELSPAQKENVIHLIELAAAIGPVLKLLELLVGGFIAFQKASAFLKDLPQILTNVAAKITAMQAAEAAAAGEMTVLSGATAVAEAALTAMGVTGVTGINAILAATGLLAVALAGIAADIWLIKRDWDVVSETMAMNAKTEADNEAVDNDKVGHNAKLKRQYHAAQAYHQFLKDGKGDRQKFTEGMDEAQLKEFVNCHKWLRISPPAACRSKSYAGSMRVFGLGNPCRDTVQKAKPFGFDVSGGVQVPVKGRAAPEANPNTVGKRQGLDVPTSVTSLGGRVELAHLYDLPSVPFGFIFQLPQKLGKRGVTKRFGQFGSHKAGDVQGFNAKGIMLGNEAGGKFVQPIFAPVRGSRVVTSQPRFCLLAAAALLFAPRKLLLKPRRFALGFPCEFRRLDLFAS